MLNLLRYPHWALARLLVSLRYRVVVQQSELASERHHAWQLLQTYPMWWEPGSSAHAQGKASWALHWVFYRIRIDHITGRRAVPGLGEAIRSRTLFPAQQGPGWLRKTFHAFLNRLPVKKG